MCTRFAAASDKVYQLLAHCRWFSLGTPAFSTTRTGCHDIAESGAKHQILKSIKSNHIYINLSTFYFQATRSKETLDLEKELDKQLLELKQTNNDEELVQHEKYVDLNEKIYEMQNTGELYTNSQTCIK